MSKFVLININLKGPVKTDLSFINGSAIRGTYIHKYINKNKIKEDISLNKELRRKLLSDDIRFYDAYPLIDGIYSIPTPLCFYASKDEIKKFSRDKTNMHIANELEDEDNIEEGYQRVNKSDFSVLKSNCLNLLSIDRIENLHNCKQINEENIFRYEAIDKNQQFYTVIQCKDDLKQEVEDTFDKEVVYIGGSKSSGYGRCELEVEGTYDFDGLINKLNINTDKTQKELNIYFISDTILRDDNGNIISYIPEKTLEKALNINNIKIKRASVLTRETKGYNAMWKTSIPSVTAIKAGSIISYSYEGNLSMDKVRDLQIEGVGSKKSEGYGRIIINPNFNVKECKNYNKKDNIHSVSINLKEESISLMANILNNINESREEEYVTKILIEAIDSKTDSRSTKKVVIDKLTNAQKGRLINMINDALGILHDKGEQSSKDFVIKFKNEIKTHTKDQFRNKSVIRLFDNSVYDYIDKLVDNTTIEELTNTRYKLDYVSFDNIKINKSSNYQLKLLLTKKIVSFNLRKKEMKNNEK